MAIQVTVAANDRMSLPADPRKRLGLSDGGALVVEELPDGVVLRTLAQPIAKAQALARCYTGGKPETFLDAFLNNRRADSGE